MNHMITAILLCLPLSGCAVAPHDHEEIRKMLREEITALENSREPTEACPPIPVLAPNATPFEHRVFTLTVIALYEQCAKRSTK